VDIMRQSLHYHRAFWLLLAGFFINRASAALIWPFLTLVMRQRLDAPLTTITMLISIQAVAGLLSTSVVGLIMDRFGRKRAMIAGLIGSAGVLVAMTGADALWQWALLIALYGALVPVFNVGANAMVADIMPPDERVNAYALMRMVANLGIAFGPALGGFLLTVSYTLSYFITAAVNIFLALLVMAFIAETLSKHSDTPIAARGGYGTLLRDRAFMSFWGVYSLLELAAAMVFVLLSVYTKENFNIPESQYGWLLTINAGMVVLLQFGVTRLTVRYRALPALATGAAFYMLGLTGFALSRGFGGFAIGMAVMTIGELIVSPTATALVANLAPSDQRARYMGMFALSYTVGSGIGPVIGGFLNDHIAPAAIWYGATVFAASAAAGFSFLSRRPTRTPQQETIPAQAIDT
jgi:MFS family permease